MPKSIDLQVCSHSQFV